VAVEKTHLNGAAPLSGVGPRFAVNVAGFSTPAQRLQQATFLPEQRFVHAGIKAALSINAGGCELEARLGRARARIPLVEL
jgi:hypothetical protein